MSKFQEISGELLAIANLPPEKRNKALSDLSVLIQGLPDYEIIQDQKDLITSIIESLIAENDADQIAKSKLVFVEDVEEQIAPTKKTRAKKVVTPTAQVESEELPDFIEKLTLVKDLPEPVKKLIGLRRVQQGTTLSIELEDTIIQVLDWADTPEGYGFWEKITQTGDLRDFKAMFGNKGEKVDELVMFAELNEFAGEFLNSEESEDLPDFIKKNLPIKDLPEQVKKLVEFRNNQESSSFNFDLNDSIQFAFNWQDTPEDEAFWALINDFGDLTEFKKLYGNKGEKVDAIINAPLEDLPNFINSEIIIKDLPEKIKLLALQRQKDAGNIPNENLYVDAFKVNGNFDWNETPEGNEFWEIIHSEGDLREFKKRYGNKGEGVDAIINAPAPAVKTRKPRTPKTPAVAPAPVVAPKPVVVEKPKPVKVEKPKPVKVEKPKPTKQTKPKVEDDLSFLNDLDNIF